MSTPPNPPSRGDSGVKIAVVLNGISLKQNLFTQKILPSLRREFSVEVFKTLSANDAVMLAAKATEKNVDIILAAGGDGTLNQVLNGMLLGNEGHSKLPVLGLIPLGSGNDFARTCGIRAEADPLISLLQAGKTKPVDVGKITFLDAHERKPHYFINVADTGMGPEVVRRVLSSGRPFGSFVAYYQAIIQTFFTYRPVHVKALTPQWKWEGAIRTFAVANGRFFGHGICVAPDARPDDGKFSCFIAGNVSVLDFILQSGRMRQGRHAVHREVEYRDAGEIELRSESPIPIEADGELVGQLPVRIEMVGSRIKFLC